jgi:hypothetical protein
LTAWRWGVQWVGPDSVYSKKHQQKIDDLLSQELATQIQSKIDQKWTWVGKEDRIRKHFSPQKPSIDSKRHLVSSSKFDSIEAIRLKIMQV